MISGCLAQAVHDRLAELVFGKALGENAVNLSGIEITQNCKQVVGHRLLVFPASDHLEVSALRDASDRVYARGNLV